jgi:glycolate oxidase iron-sulfur subunit
MSEPSLLQRLDYSVLQQCMHCGMCLPTCPTYAESQRERHSPRGRIALMRAVADGELPLNATFAEEMSYCLGCLACTTACPAGVDYATLFETARAASEQASATPQTWKRRFIRWLTLRQLFRSQRRLHVVGRLLRWYQASGLQGAVRRSGALRLLPRRIQKLEPSTPAVQKEFSDRLIGPIELPSGAERRWRVALLTGCVQDLVFADVNRATADVLLANGCEVVTPRLQGCCGSLHAHNGDLASAREMARKLIDAIDAAQVDAIISNAAGCGSHLKHYAELLADDAEYAHQAEAWAAKVKDVNEWLVEIGFRPPKASPFGKAGPVVLTYHDACHLCHGQKIARQPRLILKSIPGVEYRELPEASWCCGSAGIYSITHPETANRLRERKWANVHTTGAACVASANPGCTLHLASATDLRGKTEVVHPVVLLARAYAAEAAA